VRERGITFPRGKKICFGESRSPKKEKRIPQKLYRRELAKEGGREEEKENEVSEGGKRRRLLGKKSAGKMMNFGLPDCRGRKKVLSCSKKGKGGGKRGDQERKEERKLFDHELDS